jgi:hypothetical protein
MNKCVVAVLFFLLFAVNAFAATEYTVEPFLSLSEEYNDNLFLKRSDRISDFISNVSPGIALSAKSINTDLRLSYFPTFSFYSSHHELNDTAHHATANGAFKLSERLNTTLTFSYVRSSETSDITVIPDIGPVTIRAEWEYLTVGGGASYRLTDKLFYVVNLSYYNADTNAANLNKVKTYSGNTGLTYRSSEKTTFSATATYIKYDYNPGSDATGQNYLLEVTRILSPSVTVGASAGAIITKIQDRGNSDVDFKGGVNLRKTFERGEVSLSYNYGVIPSVESETPLRYQVVNLSFSKPFTEKFATSASASYSNYKSIRPATDADNRDTNEIRVNTALAYSFSPAVNLALSYSYTNSNDKIDTNRDFQNNIVLLTLRVVYSKKL